MNTQLTTTGVTPLTVGSQETFQLQPTLNSQPWVTISAASLILADPNGNQTTIAATVAGNSVTAQWTVTNVPGTWTRCWKVTDASGLIQFSRPIVFTVTNTP